MPRVPSASMGTFMNQLRLDTMSRAPMPYLAASARKFSRQPCSAAVWWPYRRVLDSLPHAPPIVSCRSISFATTVASGRPSFDRRTVPVRT